MSLIFIIFLLRLVGRAAVTGNHQWFHSDGFSRVAHPPEVHIEIIPSLLWLSFLPRKRYVACITYYTRSLLSPLQLVFE